MQAGHGEQTAIIWEGEPIAPRTSHPAPGSVYAHEPEIRRLTYRDLQEQTARLGNVLKGLGVKKGDIVTIYMPMVPELAVAVLACARIGAAHSVIFGGFAPTAISERVIDAGSRVILTADGGFRRGDIVPLQHNVEEAVALCENHGHIVNHVVVLKRTGHEPPSRRFAGGSKKGSTAFHWWHELAAAASDACPCAEMDSEDMLFLLYTSGSTGKPKGILHTSGGYLAFVQMTARLTFNLIPDSGQVFWCSADVGWITGHSYVLYGVLMNRVPTLMYEGAPNFPSMEGGKGDRFWAIIARHRVTHFYTAPTAIRTFMKWGDDLPARHDLSSLKVLGSVGEPINPEAWIWYHTHIGRGKCDRRHLLADRDRRPCRHAVARGHRDQARQLHAAHPRHRRRDRERGRPRTRPQPGWPLRHPQALARDAAGRLRQPRAVHQQLLGKGEGPRDRPAVLLLRRRRTARQGRLLLGAGTRG